MCPWHVCVHLFIQVTLHCVQMSSLCSDRKLHLLRTSSTVSAVTGWVSTKSAALSEKSLHNHRWWNSDSHPPRGLPARQLAYATYLEIPPVPREHRSPRLNACSSFPCRNGQHGFSHHTGTYGNASKPSMQPCGDDSPPASGLCQSICTNQNMSGVS